jgi:hypothetical protein
VVSPKKKTTSFVAFTLELEAGKQSANIYLVFLICLILGEIKVSVLHSNKQTEFDELCFCVMHTRIRAGGR